MGDENDDFPPLTADQQLELDLSANPLTEEVLGQICAWALQAILAGAARPSVSAMGYFTVADLEKVAGPVSGFPLAGVQGQYFSYLATMRRITASLAAHPGLVAFRRDGILLVGLSDLSRPEAMEVGPFRTLVAVHMAKTIAGVATTQAIALQMGNQPGTAYRRLREVENLGLASLQHEEWVPTIMPEQSVWVWRQRGIGGKITTLATEPPRNKK